MDKECDFDLPHASVVRIIKNGVKANIQLSKECRTALSKCGGIFILYLTSVANDFCKERRRTTLLPQDVYDALMEIDFEDLIPSLKSFMVNRKAKIKAARGDVSSSTEVESKEENSKRKLTTMEKNSSQTTAIEGLNKKAKVAENPAIALTHSNPGTVVSSEVKDSSPSA